MAAERFDDAAGMDVAKQTQPLCVLALQADRQAVCPGAECPVWEGGGCALERMTARGELNIDEWPEEYAADVLA